MSWIIFILYTGLLCWLLTKLRFFRHSGIKNNLLVFLFLLHVAVGCVAGYVASFTPGTDTWRYHQDALVEYQLLQTDPAAYLGNLFTTGYAHGYEGFLQTQNSFWNDMKTNLMVKIVSLLDIFSGGNYYTNVLLYNFFLFFGFVALFKLLNTYYPRHTNACIIGVFLLPSVLFFGSALHKEGIMLAALGSIWYAWHTWLEQPVKRWGRLFIVFLLMILILLLRNYMLVALVPAMGCYVAVVKWKWHKWWVVVLTLVAVFIVFWGTRIIVPAMDLPKLIQQKQTDFLQLESANTTIPLTPLQATGASFIKVFPEAIQHAWCRPFIQDVRLSWQLIPFIIEWLFYWFLLVYVLIKKRTSAFQQPFFAPFLLMGFLLLLIIGYTVPVLAAILRYRAVILPFLITPLLVNYSTKTNK